jgi:hypothetical protein
MSRSRSLALLLVVGGCAAAPLPPAPAGVPAEKRAALYEQYKLDYQYNAFTGSRWKRKDGDYMLGQLDQVLATYPETQPGVSKIQSRNTVVGVLGGIGGAVLGYTLGRNLTGPADRHWSSAQQGAGYGIGAGLILTSFLIQALWSDPAPAMTEVYNQRLRKDYVGP